jgi:acyl-coenzyme A synthetase/AMP-(fatty) acid ligase
VVLEGYEVKLTDESGSAIEEAGRGNLHVRGGTAIPYYLNKPEKTGDVYRRDDEGFYWFEGRSDDLFKCSGMWVSPGEVEDAVCSHSAVLEAAVVAAADEQGGTIAAAYVSLRPAHAPGDPLAAEIKEHAAKTLPRFKRPQRIHFMDQLPRTATYWERSSREGEKTANNGPANFSFGTQPQSRLSQDCARLSPIMK